ncbi:hypothetical protein K488DRAFT_74536 [Vararia minispora EC-137]|uniref:Uncharacterized protein n=1 Tax=Vararia minispora EC-137 TaxID=1314806 RepID=A0ACB8Q6V9_9AGAM|nr:hypothetical protein K488DRAFT_74536 [Vararia minispora EC-137]
MTAGSEVARAVLADPDILDILRLITAVTAYPIHAILWALWCLHIRLWGAGALPAKTSVFYMSKGDQTNYDQAHKFFKSPISNTWLALEVHAKVTKRLNISSVYHLLPSSAYHTPKETLAGPLRVISSTGCTTNSDCIARFLHLPATQLLRAERLASAIMSLESCRAR